jgi:PAS domain S-box-containing protein
MFPTSKDRLSFLKFLAIIYIILIGGLIGLGVLFYRNNRAYNNGAAWVRHTRLVIGHTDTILLLSQNLQWETRTYTLTGDSNAYRKFFLIRDSIRTSASYLIQLVRDNKYQQANASKLQQQIIQLIQFTDSSLQLRQTPVLVMNQFVANVRQHVILHDAINHQIELIKSEENRLLAVRRDKVSEIIQITNRIFVASGFLILILLTGGFMFVFYHFKKRQRAEKKLIESERRFQVLINSTRDLAIFMTDEKGHVLDWYEGAYKIKGYKNEEVIGKHISIFYTPESIATGEPEHNLQTAVQQGSFETEGWRVRKDGSRFWADVLITAVYDEYGKPQGFTKVTRDFSLHKSAEDEVKNNLQKEKALSEMKSNFVSMASHEFRTPLSTILSSVSLLGQYKTTEQQDKRDKHIRLIKSSVSEMVAILEEFLSLEKIEQDKVYVKKEVFNLKELAERINTQFNTTLKPAQVILYRHIGKEEVCLDAGIINHVLNNLLSNALKYSPEATEVSFETGVGENAVTLKVKDRGIGISRKIKSIYLNAFLERLIQVQ